MERLQSMERSGDSLRRCAASGAHCPICQKAIGIWPICLARFLTRPGRCWCPHCAGFLEFESIGRLRHIYLIASYSVAAVVFVPAGYAGVTYGTSRARLIYAEIDMLLLSLIAIAAALICLCVPLEWGISWRLRMHRMLVCN